MKAHLGKSLCFDWVKMACARYVPDDGLVRKLSETRQGSEVWRKRKYKLCSRDGGLEGNVRGDFSKTIELSTMLPWVKIWCKRNIPP